VLLRGDDEIFREVKKPALAKEKVEDIRKGWVGLSRML
jgi:hypothetical protein